MSWINDLAAYLDTQGVTGGVTGWTVRTHRTPADPDQVVVLTESGGFDPEPGYKQPTFQALVRAGQLDMEVARAKLQNVQDLFHELDATTINGTLYVLIRQTGDALPLGYDENERPTVAQNFRVVRE